MADFLGIPRGRLPIAIAMVIGLAAVVSWLQGTFNSTDVKKGIAIAMGYKPAQAPASPSVFEAIAEKKEGDPRCDGEVVSTLLGDVRVVCATPGNPQVTYEFRVLLDGKRPPRAANPTAEQLLGAMTKR